MPSGISQSVITPAALAQRGGPDTVQNPQRSRGAALALQTGNSDSVLADAGNHPVRAPEAESGSQGAQNQVTGKPSATTPGTGRREPAGTPVASRPTPTRLQAEVGNGVGGTVDLVG